MPEDSRTPAADPERAWAPYAPSPSCPWTPARAAHLLRRAGFGPSWGGLQQALKDGPQRTVDRLLRPEADVAAFDRASDGHEAAATASGPAAPLRAWWLRRMIETPHPLQEKMTLFWHDVVAVGADRVPHGSLVRGHLRLLREHALGRFPVMLAGIARDPATLLALGGGSNRKALPEEGVARHLLHRVTVGPDACAAADVRESARALTGWFVLRGELRRFEREHDDGPKTILGKTGPFADADVAAIAAAHPATARNVARRLYRWLVSETDAPDDALLAPVATAFGPDGDIARAVGTILRSNRFFSDDAIRRRVKRPVELAVGIVRALEGMVPTQRLADDLAALGEDLLHPPTPEGWAGGSRWINPATIAGRAGLAAALLGPKGPYGDALDPAAVAARHGHAEPGAAARFWVDLWLAPGPQDGALEALRNEAPAADGLRAFAVRLAARPEFQLA